MSKTTIADYEKFKSYCEKWIANLGLTNWNIYFNHESIDGTYAQTAWSMGSMAATIRLAKDWDDFRPRNEKQLERLAVHEVCHVLLAELCSHAEARYTVQDAIDISEHSVIRRLETALLKEKNAT